MIEISKIHCCHPSLIFNRGAIKYMIQNGYYKGRHQYFLNDDESVFFPFERFNPYKLGLVQFATDNEYKKPIKERNFKINVSLANSYYTYDFNGNRVDLFLPVTCGHCLICENSKVNRFSTQMLLESLQYDCPPLFFTLTYRDSYLPDDGVCKKHIQNFLKRLRHSLGEFRYFIVSEYGTHNTKRPHYHGILFGIDYNEFDNRDLTRIHNSIARAWSYDWRKFDPITEKIYYLNRYQDVYKNQFGIVDVQPTHGKSFRYVSKYILKKNNVPTGKNPNFVLRSSRYGIGFNYNPRQVIEFIKKSNGENFKVYNKFENRVVDCVLPTSIVNRYYPPLSRLIPRELKYAVESVNSFLVTLDKYDYSAKREIFETFKSYENRFDYLGLYIKPYKRRFSYYLPSYKHKPMSEYLSLPDYGPIYKTTVELPSELTRTLIELNHIKSIFDKYYYIDNKAVKKSLFFRQKYYTSIFNRLTALPDSMSGICSRLAVEKVRFLESNKI